MKFNKILQSVTKMSKKSDALASKLGMLLDIYYLLCYVEDFNDEK